MSENNEVTREELEDLLDSQGNYVHSPDADAWIFDACKAVEGLLGKFVITRKPEPLPGVPVWEVRYGRRNRETGRCRELNGAPLPEWWGESQETWEHVQRLVGPWGPIVKVVAE